MAQWLKDSLHKHEDPSSGPQNPCERKPAATGDCYLKDGVLESGRSLEITGQPFSRIDD